MHIRVSVYVYVCAWANYLTSKLDIFKCACTYTQRKKFLNLYLRLSNIHHQGRNALLTGNNSGWKYAHNTVSVLAKWYILIFCQYDLYPVALLEFICPFPFIPVAIWPTFALSIDIDVPAYLVFADRCGAHQMAFAVVWPALMMAVMTFPGQNDHTVPERTTVHL